MALNIFARGTASALFAIAVCKVEAVTYTFIDLGAGYYPYAVTSPANGIDFLVAGTKFSSPRIPATTPDDSHVNIYSTDPTPVLLSQSSAFYYRYSTGVTSLVPYPTGVTGMTARAINRSGVLVGTQSNSGFPTTLPYRFDTNFSTHTTLPTFAGAPGWAYGINASNNTLCVSKGTPPPSIEGAYTVTPGGTPSIRTSPSWTSPQQASGMGINDLDLVTGQVSPNGLPTQMWLSSPTGYALLGTLAAGTTSFGYAVNNSNPPLVVGYNTSGSTQKAVYYLDTVLTEITPNKMYPWSVAYAVSDLGRIAGSFRAVGSVINHAFIYTIGNTGVNDCNSFLTPAQQSVYTLHAAYGINKQGVIVGYGSVKVNPGDPDNEYTEYHGFILKPN
jgi:hypothetical protein